MDYKITNVKISVKCSQISLDTVKHFLCEKDIPFKKFNNYVVANYKYTYIIFKKNLKTLEDISHINITNIQKLDCLGDAIDTIKLFDGNAVAKSYTVDNITVSKNFYRFINFDDFFQKIPSDICVTYNAETFPGIFLKFPNKLGTAIIFHTGKCVLLGCKTVENIEAILEVLKQILK
jgi:Transcription factor TFIID (or TATA-binding protein, TBP)